MGSLDDLKKKYGIKENTPTPPKENIKEISPTIAEMREKLELKKLEMEIAKLETPNTNLDYVKTLLEQQATNFKNMLEAERRYNDLALKVKELEISKPDGGDFGEDFLYSLIPLLPELIKNKPQTPTEKPLKTEEVKPIITAEQQAEIIRQVKSGELNEEQFIKAALEKFPMLTGKEELIKAEYQKILKLP